MRKDRTVKILEIIISWYLEYIQLITLLKETNFSDKEKILEKLDKPEERKEKSSIEVYVYIIDTFCEFSEQIIEFPATPCGSYSMVKETNFREWGPAFNRSRI